MSDDLTLLNADDVCRLIGGSKPINRTTLYRGVRSGIFPAPILMGRVSRWDRSECVEAVRKAAERRVKRG
jgi:predicted DNA-binding transcriptional regulator AlpA